MAFCDGLGFEIEVDPTIPNLYEQNVEGGRLWKNNAEWARRGFEVTLGTPSARGLVVGVKGDVQAARLALADNALVASVEFYEYKIPEPELTQIRNQERVGSVARQILRAGRGISGFAGVRIDGDALTVEVFWKDPVPADIQQFVGTTAEGVTVLPIVVVAYSDKELSAAASRLFDAARRGETSMPRTVQAREDFSGLVVGLSTEDLKRGVSVLEAEMSAIAGMPATAQYGDVVVQ